MRNIFLNRKNYFLIPFITFFILFFSLILFSKSEVLAACDAGYHPCNAGSCAMNNADKNDATGCKDGAVGEYCCQDEKSSGGGVPPVVVVGNGTCGGPQCDNWSEKCNWDGTKCRRDVCTHNAINANCSYNSQQSCEDNGCKWTPPPVYSYGQGSYTPPPTSTPVLPTLTSVPCTRKAQGDANCDGKVDGIDYSLWLNNQCNPGANQTCANLKADFNSDGKVNDDDYNLWFTNRNT